MEDGEVEEEETTDTGDNGNEKSDSDTTSEFGVKKKVTMKSLEYRYKEIISLPCLLIRRAKGHLYSHLGNPVDRVNSTS